MTRHTALAVFVITLTSVVAGQQAPDPAFRPPIEKPAFDPGRGPLVLLDEAHANFHTLSGRYAPFGDLLRRDGYVVESSKTPFRADALKKARVLVIANASRESNGPNPAAANPSAFSRDEIAAVRQWVSEGGALFLIADHAPFAGAAAELGRAFGIRFRDGYVARKGATGPMVFRRADNSLRSHAVTTDVSEVATFTGSSFELDVPGDPLLVFGADAYSSRRDDNAAPVAVAGHLQGALLRIGSGRIAVFGEAAMFSAQLAGPDKRPMGMNAPVARDNPRFLLNVMRWLTAPQ